MLESNEFFYQPIFYNKRHCPSMISHFALSMRHQYNAFKVCNDLTCRIDGAPVPNGYMKSYTSQKNKELFFSNHQHMKEFLGATEKEKESVPGCHYFKKVHDFFDIHFGVGEKYMEFVRYCCSDSTGAPCAHCAESGWVSTNCTRVSKPMPDYSADGHHYKSVLDTPLEIDGKVRSVDAFQPRKNVKEYLAQEMLKSDNYFEHFCRTFACEKILVKKYVQHLQILEINKWKRVDIRKIQQQEEESNRYKEYDWTKLFEEGELKKLKVKELDKYLIHHNLRKP